MSPEFIAYRTFLALRNHFTKPDFDFFLYNGKATTSEEKFRTNKNYKEFVALSKKVNQVDVTQFMSANWGHSKKQTVWISDLLTLDASDIWKKHRAYVESSGYRFQEDMKRVGPFEEVTASRGGAYPKIVSDTMSGRIAIETFCILNNVLGNRLMAVLNERITEKYLWPTWSMRVIKFQPFIKIPACAANVTSQFFTIEESVAHK